VATSLLSTCSKMQNRRLREEEREGGEGERAFPALTVKKQWPYQFPELRNKELGLGGRGGGGKKKGAPFPRSRKKVPRVHLRGSGDCQKKKRHENYGSPRSHQRGAARRNICMDEQEGKEGKEKRRETLHLQEEVRAQYLLLVRPDHREAVAARRGKRGGGKKA